MPFWPSLTSGRFSLSSITPNCGPSKALLACLSSTMTVIAEAAWHLFNKKLTPAHSLEFLKREVVPGKTFLPQDLRWIRSSCQRMIARPQHFLCTPAIGVSMVNTICGSRASQDALQVLTT